MAKFIVEITDTIKYRFSVIANSKEEIHDCLTNKTGFQTAIIPANDCRLLKALPLDDDFDLTEHYDCGKTEWDIKEVE